MPDASLSQLTDPFCTPERLTSILHDVRFGGGMAASGQGARFGGNLFTRDSLRMMRDVMEHPSYHSLVREMLGTLPQWQGVKEDPLTNEFPDALQHQVFRECIAGRWLPPELIDGDRAAAYWTERWNVPLLQDPVHGRHFVIYNSSDGPPLYLITLAEFCRRAGFGVMGDRFQHWPSGTTRTVAEAARRLVDFIIRAIKASEDRGNGLYAVPNTNPLQTSPSGVMRDGWDSYYRPETGGAQPADYGFMAYVENQALCYEALVLAANVLFPTDPETNLWLATADQIRKRTIQKLWMEHSRFFAAALDKDGQITLESTAAAELLNGPFFDGLANGPDYIRSIIRWLYSPQVMTPIGPRMVSLAFARFEGEFYPYQSTGSVWSVTNGLIAKGLRRQGFYVLARDIGIDRLVGWFNRAHAAIELTYVERRLNHPVYLPDADEVTALEADLTIAAADMGSVDQGWGVTAALHELWQARHGLPDQSPNSWQYRVGRQMLQYALAVPPASAGISVPHIRVDIKRGRELQSERAAALRLAH